VAVVTAPITLICGREGKLYNAKPFLWMALINYVNIIPAPKCTSIF